MSTLSREQLEAQKAEWTSAAQSAKQRLEELVQEANKVQQQLIALDGAIQGCDVMLKKLDAPESADAQ